MAKIFEIKQQIDQKRAAMKALMTRAETEKRDMTEGEDGEFETLKADMAKLKKQVGRLEDLAEDIDSAEEEDADELDMEEDDDEDRDCDTKGKRSTPAAGRITRKSTPRQVVEIRQAAAVHTRKHEYSLMRAIRGLSNKKAPKLDGLEAEWSREVEIQTKRKAEGFFLPHHFGRPDLAERHVQFDREKRTLSLTTGAGGIPVVTEPTLIEFLYNRCKVMDAGATIISDMVNKFSLPRMSSTSTSYWVSEGGAPSSSNPTLDQVTFTPQTLADSVVLTRKFIMQNSTSAEMLVRTDVTRQIALGIDYAALNGSGSSNQPLGIFQDPSVGSVEISANSGAPTWTAIVSLETLVSSANADVGKLSYMTNANGRGTLKTTPKIAASPSYPIFLSENGECNGHPLHMTNQIPTNFTQGSGTALCGVAFGNWADIAVALFGATDILVDPYTMSTSGGVIVNIFQDADIHLRHEASFATLLFSNNQAA
jgi:HK97 family phage major capsid protein